MVSISLRKHLRPLLEFAPLIYAFNIYTYLEIAFKPHMNCIKDHMVPLRS